MFEDAILSISNQAMLTVLLISAPVLGAGLLTGLLISILQATTQLQEMTLAFVPKIVVVFLVLILFGPWMLDVMIGFTYNLLVSIPRLLSLG